MSRERALKRVRRRPDAIVERRRASVAREWRETKAAFRTGTGLSAESAGWAAGIAGLALGLELARRWLASAARRGS